MRNQEKFRQPDCNALTRSTKTRGMVFISVFSRWKPHSLRRRSTEARGVVFISGFFRVGTSPLVQAFL